MPPRSFYVSPRPDDYDAILSGLTEDLVGHPLDRPIGLGLPYIEDVDHIAGYLGVSPALIRQILRNPAFHYRVFEIEKGDGGRRQICTPRTYLKAIQWWILDNILERFTCSTAVHGFRRGRSYVSNAIVHAGKAHILNVDIKQFFPSINTKMIEGVFSGFGYTEPAASLLAALVTFQDEAPTGAPTSPMIGNIVLADFDEEIEGLSAKNGIIYSRYADDLTFSCENRIDESFCILVEERIAKFGFQLNPRKTRFMGRGNRMEVTGIVINDGINMPRKWRNTIRGILHRAQQNPEKYSDRFDFISGIYGTLASVDPEEKKPLTITARLVVEELKNHRASSRATLAPS